MSTSPEHTYIALQRIVRIILTVTVLFGLLLLVDPPFSVLGIVLCALMMALLVIAILLLMTMIRSERLFIK